ncbi:unnamed protein product [Nippostrongylus brasiliensis]|uniref:Transmembrane protein 144 (inferred by orthology to a human protein) n=1 Tax=Nippostrongylus brasiliensis TaxID=27835 RepID=A0A0N4XU19_NIPBR|nr:unnamed protein product [Nippostrongylus brasiliensis]
MSNSTLGSENDPSAGGMVLGYFALLISCISFGTMFTPLKRRDTKDGFFVQWVECSVVLVAGYIINVVRDFPQFEWIAGIGGLLYATGNVFSVPIVNGLGMGVGFLIWGSMQIIVGWSVARFGLFGWLAATEVKHNVMNYIGMIITLISGILFIFVKHKDEDSSKSSCTAGGSTALEGEGDGNLTISKVILLDKKQLIGKIPYVLMTMLLAVLHGLMMTPIEILQQRHPSSDHYQVFDYIWSFYSTVFVFSTLYFVIYCIIRRKKAYIDRELVLPSVGYGILWTCGMTFWFLSSHQLSQVVAYPITTRVCFRKASLRFTICTSQLNKFISLGKCNASSTRVMEIGKWNNRNRKGNGVEKLWDNLGPDSRRYRRCIPRNIPRTARKLIFATRAAV